MLYSAITVGKFDNSNTFNTMSLAPSSCHTSNLYWGVDLTKEMFISITWCVPLESTFALSYTHRASMGTWKTSIVFSKKYYVFFTCSFVIIVFFHQLQVGVPLTLFFFHATYQNLLLNSCHNSSVLMRCLYTCHSNCKDWFVFHHLHLISPYTFYDLFPNFGK